MSTSENSSSDQSFLTTPIDSRSEQRLAANGLRFALVDTNDPVALEIWLQAESRGFHESRITRAKLDVLLPAVKNRRTTGVWDESSADAASPVSTICTWPMDLTVPGEASVAAWAISSVTVAPTHRRRGIARAMLEAELRTAHSLGYPVAMLNVSEATIYGRYGFGAAAMMADWTINTARASFTGPTASGRVHFVEAEQLREDGFELVEQVRLSTPGQIAFSGILWERLLGFDGDPEAAARLRFVRYDDADGDPAGFAVYRVREDPTDFAKHVLELSYLVAATDDAYAGLWSHLLEIDLVDSITAQLRPVDEPLYWQVSDHRAVRQSSVRDHLWTRILDVPGALEARRYATPGQIVLDVADDLGFADGLYLLTIDAAGAATVELLETEAPDDAAALALTINDLSSVYLGGVPVVSLVRAGRVTELRPGSAARCDTAFRSAVAPWLSIWF